MKKIYYLLTILSLSFFLFSDLEARSYKGYIVTRGGGILTGTIGDIYHSEYQGMLTFINDFGTRYTIHPALLKGFVYEKGNETLVFESFYTKKRWVFLKVLYKGEELALYKTTEERYEVPFHGVFDQQYIYDARLYFLQLKGKRIYKLKRWGYKAKFRRIIGKYAPELAEKIGTKGYRFKDLIKIVEEFEVEYRRTRWML